MAQLDPIVYRANNVTGTPSAGDILNPRFTTPTVHPFLLFPGQWVSPSSIDGQVTNVTLSSTRAMFDLFYVSRPLTIDEIGIDIFAAGGAGNTAEAGVFARNTSTGFPGSLLVSRTFSDLTATGIVSATGVNFTLDEGWYFTGVAANVGANAFQIRGAVRSAQMFAGVSTLYSVTGVTGLASNPTIASSLNTTNSAATPLFKFLAA